MREHAFARSTGAASEAEVSGLAAFLGDAFENLATATPLPDVSRSEERSGVFLADEEDRPWARAATNRVVEHQRERTATTTVTMSTARRQVAIEIGCIGRHAGKSSPERCQIRDEQALNISLARALFSSSILS